MFFYEQLEKLCQKKGIKPSTLVESLGMSKGTMSNWKRGGTPNAEAVVRIAEHFGVTTDYLLLGHDSNEESEDELIYVSEFDKKLIETYRNYKKSSFSEQIMETLTNFFPEITSSKFNAFSTLSKEEREALNRFNRLEPDQQIKAQSYMIELYEKQEENKGWIEKNSDWTDNSDDSVAAEEPLKKTGTTNSSK